VPGVPRLLIILSAALLASCATVRPEASGPPGIALDGDAAAARAVLGAWLLGEGWTVRFDHADGLEAERGGEAIVLTPLLDDAGLDRLLLTRRYALAGGGASGVAEDFADELNRRLNVGQFSVQDGSLALLADLPFVDRVEGEVLAAFIAFTGEVREAVDIVEDGRGLLAPVEGAPGAD
jgi:hypothetical protein